MDRQAVVKVDLGSGRYARLEVTKDPEADVSIGEVFSFQGVIESLQAISDGVHSALKSVKPHRASVELGVDVGLEAGGLTALIVKGTGKATLKVTLEWEHPVEDD